MPDFVCYASSAREYRKQMGGSGDATALPAPTDQGIAKWENVGKAFDQMVTDIEDALRAAEAAHEGRAADAANASIAQIKPFAEEAANTSRGVKAALQEQASYQREAFDALPAEGDTLPSGQEAILDPPQKGWVEEWGLDSNPITSWMSDYEERQQAYIDTNQQANQAMERYRAQTEGVIARLPEFKPADQTPPPPPPQPQQPTSTTSGYPSSSSHSSSSSSSSGLSTSVSPAGTSSAWAATPSHTPTYTPPSPPPAPATAPAPSTPSWAAPGMLPPGVVRGPDGTLYRQNPQTGAWERQNPYNGRWAPSPNGGPGGARGGAAGLGMRGGVGGMGRGMGPGPQLGAGGRVGVGGLTGGPGAGGSATAAGAGARGGAAGAMGGAGAAGRGQQKQEDQEHERPSWLVEDEDVFTNDMQRVAPAVFGDTSTEER
ncbi:hypothetical protein GCM10011581_09830 [Saccharopolyspora subtropica]|uniref:PPE family protein n=1 Tax=Saccharopolyspora thermophila TaxID=89367 RepID=A0A917JL65_9PSEU|nr:hypothetical protein [Saccharopolyspora subtropica]GGI74884.1 hypothetical protein GCM10011581_09830 [Saccharopolyspora subtropica]